MLKQENYEINVDPYLTNRPTVTVTKDMLDKATKFAEAKAKAKLAEGGWHATDNDKEVKRNLTGILGEMAVEQFLGINFIDWEISPNSSHYDVPDIGIANIGVKTVEYGKYPTITKKNNYPQLICILKRNPMRVVICGLASPYVLNTYQSDEYILNEKMRALGKKTGFYGFRVLQPIGSLYDLTHEY